MNLKQKVMLGSGFLLLSSLFIWNMEFTDKEISVPDTVMSAIVFGDTNTVETVEAEVVFNDSLISNLETTMQGAILDSSSAFVKEKEEELRIEKERQLELERQEREKRLSQAVKVKGNAVLSYNPFVKSGLTVEQYNKILKGTGLEGCGQSYYNMENNYNINGLFALSVAFHESGYGRHRANTNNFYGMRGSSGWMSFESPDSNIQYFGKLMNKPLYKGKSIENIGKVYCPGTYLHWAEAVKSMMRNSFNKI